MSWLPRTEVAKALDVPLDTLKKWCSRRGWRTRVVRGKSGREVELDVSSLPSDLRERLFRARANEGRLSIDDVRAVQLAEVRDRDLRQALAKARLVVLAGEVVAQAPHGERGKALDAWLRRYNQGGAAPEVLEELGPVTKRTLYRWRQVWRQEGLAGLLDRRGGAHRRAPGGGELEEFVLACLAQDLHQRAANIYRLLPARFPNQPLPSRRHVERLVARLRRENHERLLALHQPSLHKRLYQISLGRSDADLSEPNERWEIDSTRADIMGRPRMGRRLEIVTSEGKRYTLIAVVDVFSRRAVAVLEEAGGAYAINTALIKAVRRLGVPLEIVMDLGKDYRSRAVQAFCLELGIHVPDIPGYMPELKPHVERFFATIQGQLFALLPGYTANRLDKRREEIRVEMTREDLQREIDLWIEAYERRPHGSTGQTPLERGNPPGWRRRTVPEEHLRLLLNPPVERSVRHGRIRFKGGWFFHRALLELDGSARVEVRADPEDAGLVHVWHRGRFLCVAQDLRRLGLTPAQIAAERKAWKDVRRRRRQADQALTRAVDLAELNRKALELEISQGGAVEEAPVETALLPHLAAAARARREAARPQTETAAEIMGLMEEGLAGRHLALAGADCQSEDDPLARPKFFEDLAHRYRWVRKRQAAGLPVTAEDMEAAAEFEQSEEFRLLSRDFWDRDAKEVAM